MPLPVSLKSCRSHRSPAIRSSLCRSTPWPQRTGLDFAHSEFLRDRLKKNSKQCSSLAKLKRKRRPFQVEAEEASRSRRSSCLGPDTWLHRPTREPRPGPVKFLRQIDLQLLLTGVVLHGMKLGACRRPLRALIRNRNCVLSIGELNETARSGASCSTEYRY